MSRKYAHLTKVKVYAQFIESDQGKDGCCLTETGLLSPEKTIQANFSQTKNSLRPSADYCGGLPQIKAFYLSPIVPTLS
jgi:hypothetical protein